jgi:hypothetical protein
MHLRTFVFKTEIVENTSVNLHQYLPVTGTLPGYWYFSLVLGISAVVPIPKSQNSSLFHYLDIWYCRGLNSGAGVSTDTGGTGQSSVTGYQGLIPNPSYTDELILAFHTRTYVLIRFATRCRDSSVGRAID